MTTLLWTYVAWCALALACERHHEQVFGRNAPFAARQMWRVAGWGAMALALAQALLVEGWALGAIGFIGALATAGFACVATLSMTPRRCLPLSTAAALLGAAMAFS